MAAATAALSPLYRTWNEQKEGSSPASLKNGSLAARV
jgi:hypothetical protein